MLRSPRLPRLLPATVPSLAVLLALAAAPPLPAQGGTDVRLDTGSAPGSADSGEVQLASSGDAVYAVWLDRRAGNADVFFSRSLDGGATWLPQDVRLDTGTAPGAGRSTEVRIAADGAAVFVVWTEDAGAPHILFNRSLDGGATWLAAPRQLDVGGGPGSTSQNPTIACFNALVFVAWSESRGGLDGDIYFDRSLDGGSTWLGSTLRVDTGTPPSSPGGSYSPSIAVQLPHVYIVWDDFRSPNYGVWFNHSQDLGLSFQPADVPLHSGQSPAGASSTLPQIAAVGNAVHVCWTEGRFGGSDIFVQSSADAGATWLPSDVRVDVGNLPGATRTGQAVIAASASAVHVAWRDSRNHANNGDVYYNRSLDGGVTWGSADVRLDTGTVAGSADSGMPQLAVAGHAVAAVWSDARSGSYDVVGNTSPDDGATWLATAVRVDAAPAGSDAVRPALASNGTSFVVAWDDLRNGQGDVFANVLAGWQPYGAGTPGTAATVPTLRGASPCVLGATATLAIADGLGGAPALLAAGAGPGSRNALPLLGGTLLVNPSANVFLLLGGSPGAPGGSATFGIALPQNPALLGANAVFQALLLDAGAPQGVSMTNGLSLWIG